MHCLLYSPDENLQFVFKYIDPEDEEKLFVFTVAITAQNKYSGNNYFGVFPFFFLSETIGIKCKCTAFLNQGAAS